MKTVLTIAGFDPSSGAGVTADLAVMASKGMFGTSCVTALTVQSTLGVKAVHAVSADIVEDTLEWLAEDLTPAGLKIGMLANAGIVEAVGRFIAQGQRGPVVLDPVIRSSSGNTLLDDEGVDTMRQLLLSRVAWVTPNTAELEVLTGMRVDGVEDVQRATRWLGGRWPGLNVVTTGGHLDVPNDFVRMADGREEWVTGERIESTSTHGTGCAFSTALMCGLVQGLDGLAAVCEAKTFVAEGIRRAVKRGGGKGPMDLYWPMRG
jgi:hydroxymethylpyrimidine/phosphomethylpyrimidine kinase